MLSSNESKIRKYFELRSHLVDQEERLYEEGNICEAEKLYDQISDFEMRIAKEIASNKKEAKAQFTILADSVEDLLPVTENNLQAIIIKTLLNKISYFLDSNH